MRVAVLINSQKSARTDESPAPRHFSYASSIAPYIKLISFAVCTSLIFLPLSSIRFHDVSLANDPSLDLLHAICLGVSIPLALDVLFALSFFRKECYQGL